MRKVKFFGNRENADRAATELDKAVEVWEKETNEELAKTKQKIRISSVTTISAGNNYGWLVTVVYVIEPKRDEN